jgi:putative NADH-flavin reductase
MRIAIFGASGRTGRHLVEQAVARGHRVTAIIRNLDGAPSDLDGTVRLVNADVMDAEAIAPALADLDGVVSALSGPGRAPSSVWSDSTRSIVQAMRKASVRRYIAITGSMLDATGDGPFFRFIGKPIARRMLKGSANDMRRAEQVIHQSGLDWTIIRAPRLTDKPARGRYRIAVERNVPREFSLARADLATCTLAVLADDATIRRHVFVAQ